MEINPKEPQLIYHTIIRKLFNFVKFRLLCNYDDNLNSYDRSKITLLGVDIKLHQDIMNVVRAFLIVAVE